MNSISVLLNCFAPSLQGTVLPKSMANQPRRYFLAMTFRSKIRLPGVRCSSFSVDSTAVLKEINSKIKKIKKI